MAVYSSVGTVNIIAQDFNPGYGYEGRWPKFEMKGKYNSVFSVP